MSYVKASDVLPSEVLDLIRNYVEYGYIYIPKKEGSRKPWGENTNSKEEISVRNADIYKNYTEGISVKTLSEKYYLSPKSIQRIVLQTKRKHQ